MFQIRLLTPARVLLTIAALACSMTTVSSGGLPITHVGRDGDLQAALDRARPGEVILLEAGARFVGNFVLPAVKSSATSWVTVRSAAADEELPDYGQRVTPAYSPALPVIQSPNAQPALRTAPGAHHWILIGIEFRGNANGFGDIIQLGDGSKDQSSLDQVPHDLILDRVYVHGDPLVGQKRGIALNSASTQILNSWISDIKAIGMDTQAIGSWNGPGPYALINNYLEAAGENVMFGGGDPGIKSLIATGIDVRRNTFVKPLAWKSGILPVAANVRATSSTVGGSLRAATYSYRIVAERDGGQQSTARSAGSPPVSVTIARGVTSGSVTVTWDAVDTAQGYRVYRRGGGPDVYWRTTETTFVDIGAADGTQGGAPAQPTMWQVKNLFELKNARQVRVEGNVFQGNWVAAQPGYAIVMTPRNQDGAASWARVEDVTFTNNIIRSVAGVFNITGTDDVNQSDKTRRIVIRNNLAIDVDGSKYGVSGSNGDFVQVGHGPDQITIEHNTVLHTGRVISAYGAVGGQPEPIKQFAFRNNVMRHNAYGVIGTDYGIGWSTLSAFFPDVEFQGNVLAGGDQSRYPLNNFFPSVDDFMRMFVDPSNEDYTFTDDGPLVGMGSDGLTPGVDMTRLNAAIAGTAPPRPGSGDDRDGISEP